MKFSPVKMEANPAMRIPTPVNTTLVFEYVVLNGV